MLMDKLLLVTCSVSTVMVSELAQQLKTDYRFSFDTLLFDRLSYISCLANLGCGRRLGTLPNPPSSFSTGVLEIVRLGVGNKSDVNLLNSDCVKSLLTASARSTERSSIFFVLMFSMY